MLDLASFRQSFTRPQPYSRPSLFATGNRYSSYQQPPSPYFRLSYLKLQREGRHEAAIFQHNATEAFRHPIGLPTVPYRGVRRVFPHKKFLLLDMDETLLSTGQDLIVFQYWVSYKNERGDTIKTLGLNVRPYVNQFLAKVSQVYEIAIYTAGSKEYADPLLDLIDPYGLISHRFYKEHCFQLPGLVQQGIRLKSVLQFGVDPSHIVLVDNSPFCLVLDPLNGIPVIPFYSDQDDSELLNLRDYLLALSGVEDVRRVNSAQFRTGEWGRASLQALYKVSFDTR